MNNPKKDSEPIDKRAKAPKKYKSLTIHFNFFEFDRLDSICVETGESKLSFIRRAISDAIDKQS